MYVYIQIVAGLNGKINTRGDIFCIPQSEFLKNGDFFDCRPQIYFFWVADLRFIFRTADLRFIIGLQTLDLFLLSVWTQVGRIILNHTHANFTKWKTF